MKVLFAGGHFERDVIILNYGCAAITIAGIELLRFQPHTRC
jgi:hypothetical protein